MEGTLLSRPISLTIVTAALAGCASTPAPFPIRTDPAARSLLTGEWSGTYEGGLQGRNGSIVFVLQAGDSAVTAAEGEHAHGDVVMIPAGQNEPLRPAEDMAGAPLSQVLTIDFVRAKGTHLTGTLKPFRDPACNCSISTTFVGEITGDVIKGTFTSLAPDGRSQTGEWELQRKKS